MSMEMLEKETRFYIYLVNGLLFHVNKRLALVRVSYGHILCLHF